MTFHIKTLLREKLVFKILPPEVHARKTSFTISYLRQNFMWHMVALMTPVRSRIVTHSYAVSFSIKLILCKNNIIF